MSNVSVFWPVDFSVVTTLASVVTTEKSTGQIPDTFDIVKDTSRPAGQQEKRSATMTLTAFHFDDDLHGPRNGSYSWEREPGVGGKFQFTDSLRSEEHTSELQSLAYLICRV